MYARPVKRDSRETYPALSFKPVLWPPAPGAPDQSGSPDAQQQLLVGDSARHVRPHPHHGDEVERVGAEVPIELVHGGWVSGEDVTPAEAEPVEEERMPP